MFPYEISSELLETIGFQLFYRMTKFLLIWVPILKFSLRVKWRNFLSSADRQGAGPAACSWAGLWLVQHNTGLITVGCISTGSLELDARLLLCWCNPQHCQCLTAQLQRQQIHHVPAAALAHSLLQSVWELLHSAASAFQLNCLDCDVSQKRLNTVLISKSLVFFQCIAIALANWATTSAQCFS